MLCKNPLEQVLWKHYFFNCEKQLYYIIQTIVELYITTYKDYGLTFFNKK